MATAAVLSREVSAVRHVVTRVGVAAGALLVLVRDRGHDSGLRAVVTGGAGAQAAGVVKDDVLGRHAPRVAVQALRLHDALVHRVVTREHLTVARVAVAVTVADRIDHDRRGAGVARVARHRPLRLDGRGDVLVDEVGRLVASGLRAERRVDLGVHLSVTGAAVARRARRVARRDRGGDERVGAARGRCRRRRRRRRQACGAVVLDGQRGVVARRAVGHDRRGVDLRRGAGVAVGQRVAVSPQPVVPVEGAAGVAAVAVDAVTGISPPWTWPRSVAAMVWSARDVGERVDVDGTDRDAVDEHVGDRCSRRRV